MFRSLAQNFISKPMACSKSCLQTEDDFISNAPDIVIDKILKRLPIRTIARTSVLSEQWRRTWLSLNSLIFDDDFWREQNNEDGSVDWEKGSRIISSILFHHDGPVHDFYLSIPSSNSWMDVDHNQWLSFLSKNGVRKIVIDNCYQHMGIDSYIFWCSELVHLQLHCFTLKPLPTRFRGFPNLKHLELFDIKFTEQNIFCSLIKNCRMLAKLVLLFWSGMDHIVIDSPSLQTLELRGNFESLAFRNVGSLESISVWLLEMQEKFVTVDIIAAVIVPASSCQLKFIEFNGYFCKVLAAGGIIRSFPVQFNHLNKLCLYELDLGDFGVHRYVLAMVECCPYIKKLDISVWSRENADQHILEYNNKHKLDQLVEINIKGIRGSSAELKLIEYLLATAVVLENLFFMTGGTLDVESELKMSRALMRFPRASPKASLVCLKK